MHPTIEFPWIKRANHCLRSGKIRASFAALTGEPLVRLKDFVKEKDQTVKEWESTVTRECTLRLSIFIDKVHRTQLTKRITADDEEFQKKTSKTLKDVKENATTIIDRTKSLQQDTAAIIKTLQEFSESGIQDWLMTDEGRANDEQLDKLREAINGERHKFLDQERYEDWRQLPQSMLWLHAPCKSLFLVLLIPTC